MDRLIPTFLDAWERADTGALARCWTDGASITVDGRTRAGRPAVTALLTTSPRRLEPVVGGFTTIDDHRATGRWLVAERHDASRITVGLAVATSVRDGEGWRLADWTEQRLWSGPPRRRGPLGDGSLVLCSGTIGADVPFVAKAAAAATAGFDGISCYLRELDAARVAGWNGSELSTYLDLLGLAVAEADGMFAWSDATDGSDDLLGQQFAAAASVGARSATLLLPPGAPRPEESFDPVVVSLTRAADRAAEHGLLVHLEPFAWSQLRSVAAAADLCRRAARPNVGLMLDAWHLAAGPDRGRLPAGLDGAMVVGVQLCECADPDPPDVARAGMHERLRPGDGPARTASIVRDLRRLGCTAPIGVEIYSDVLHAETPDVAARIAMDSLRHVLDPATA